MNNEKVRAKKAIGALLKILDVTQSEFAEMAGVSLDTVKSWSLGRNSISQEFETRITMATGAVIHGEGSLTVHWRAGTRSGFVGKAFSKDAFDFWRTHVATSDKETAGVYIKRASEALDLLFRAAALPVRGKRHKLPGVWNSFEQWIVSVTQDCNLEPQMEKLHGEKLPGKFFWRGWRKPSRSAKIKRATGK